jgi:hypothetical protein
MNFQNIFINFFSPDGILINIDFNWVGEQTRNNNQICLKIYDKWYLPVEVVTILVHNAPRHILVGNLSFLDSIKSALDHGDQETKHDDLEVNLVDVLDHTDEVGHDVAVDHYLTSFFESAFDGSVVDYPVIGAQVVSTFS